MNDLCKICSDKICSRFEASIRLRRRNKFHAASPPAVRSNCGFENRAHCKAAIAWAKACAVAVVAAVCRYLSRPFSYRSSPPFEIASSPQLRLFAHHVSSRSPSPLPRCAGRRIFLGARLSWAFAKAACKFEPALRGLKFNPVQRRAKEEP